jgi:hypothetical protein
MEELTAHDFIENIRAWKPTPETGQKIRGSLERGKTPEQHLEPLKESIMDSAAAAFGYLEAVHGLVGAGTLDSKVFVRHLARVSAALDALRAGMVRLRTVFRAYHADFGVHLRHDKFDTTYYDAIQNFDVKGALRTLLKDVDVLLKSFSLVSADLSGVKCLDLYEDCIRFHLYVQYLSRRATLPPEECWSILFDLNNLFTEEGAEEGDLKEELEEFQEEIEEIRKNQQN